MTKIDNNGLLIGYKSIGDRLVYDETWDKIAELLISDKIKENKIKKSKTAGGKIKNYKVR